jgi:hypothetical protein
MPGAILPRGGVSGASSPDQAVIGIERRQVDLRRHALQFFQMPRFLSREHAE